MIKLVFMIAIGFGIALNGAAVMMFALSKEAPTLVYVNLACVAMLAWLLGAIE